MKFDVKIDKWVNILLYGSVLMLVPIFFFVPSDEWIVLFGTMVLMMLLIIPIVRISYYELQDEFLVMRLGYIKAKIKYENIKSIESIDGWNTTSSMALSREKVKITEHNKSIIRGTTYISPKNRELFILDLKQKCRNLDNGLIEFD